MTTPNQPALDRASIAILTDIMNARAATGKSVDSVHYRAQNEESLATLDKLEKEGYLKNENEHYFLSVLSLAAIDDSNSRDILNYCEQIFSILRDHYRSKPRESISVPELARVARLDVQITGQCVEYMLEGSWWQSHSSDFSEPEKASVQPSERILKYKTFREVLEELIEFRQKRNLQYYSGWVGEWPLDVVASSTLGRFDAVNIKQAWEKALERRSTDPEGAVTAARTLVETVCKFILDEEKVSYDSKFDLPKLYRLTAQELNLAPDDQSEDVFKRILGSCQSVIEGLANLRNLLGDAHGKGKTGTRPASRHAELAVNLAGTMSSFFIQTWESRKRP